MQKQLLELRRLCPPRRLRLQGRLQRRQWGKPVLLAAFLIGVFPAWRLTPRRIASGGPEHAKSRSRCRVKPSSQVAWIPRFLCSFGALWFPGALRPPRSLSPRWPLQSPGLSWVSGPSRPFRLLLAAWGVLEPGKETVLCRRVQVAASQRAEFVMAWLLKPCRRWALQVPGVVGREPAGSGAAEWPDVGRVDRPKLLRPLRGL